MPNFWLLSSLTLQVDTYTQTFRASEGDIIRLAYEPEDIFFETASKKQKKIRVGYRVHLTIETFIWNTITKADFLRMCQNAETVLIYSAAPEFIPTLEGKNLVFEKIEVVEMYTDTKFLLRAEAKVEELLANIPALA